MDLATMKRRSRFLSDIRGFFAGADYTEVDTPHIAPRLLPEPSIEVFAVTARGDDSSRASSRAYLVPSPELWMKRLLADGSGSIYQIQHCFRDMEESGALHNPEFTMLEWYTLDHDHRDEMRTTERLLGHLAASRSVCSYQGTPLHLAAPYPRLSMADLFQTHAGIRIDRVGEKSHMRAAARNAGIAVGDAADWEECFNKVFLTLVEPELPTDRPVFITDYPSRIPTLAHTPPGSEFSCRWELYVAGIEIANCYAEETDPTVAARLIRTESLRKRSARTPHPADTFLQSRELPACSGVALGVDRLFMVFEDAPTLQRVIFFPSSDSIPSHEEC